MALDSAREYLARVLPWPHAGEEKAFVNIHWTFKSPKFDKPGWTGRAVKDVNEAIKSIEFAMKGGTTQDLYVCMSTQREAKEETARNGWKYHKPIRSQKNAVSLKALFLDIDIKGGPNGYDTVGEAVTSLGNFMKATGMPKPSMIVGSGGGMHVYWILSRAITPDKWRPLAFALAEATKKEGLKCDTQVTIDSARVLRLPDTFNRKQDKPRPVRIMGTPLDFDYALERIEKSLTPYVSLQPSSLTSLTPRTPLAQGQNDELVAGISIGRSGPVDLDAVATECGFIKEAITSGGKDFTNPLWNLTSLIATFCDKGRLQAHRMGAKHPGYTKDSTDNLFHRKEREKDEKDLGWPRCQTISATGATQCSTCPHYALQKSPLNLANKVVTKPVGPQTDLPPRYSRDANGIISYTIIEEDGNTTRVPISAYPMMGPWLQKDPWTLHFMTRTELGKKETQVSIKSEEVGLTEMRRVLQSQGFMVRTRDFKALAEFFMDWIGKLQQTKDAIISSSPFGWQTDKGGKCKGFVYGGSCWSAGKPIPAASPDPVLARQYEPQGQMSTWSNAADLITKQQNPALDAVIASAFGAPLVKWTGHKGLLMSTYSQESGIGKSTALAVAQAVWGDPIRAMQSLNDTQNSVINKIGEIQNLPMYWDELKTEDETRKFISFVFQLNQGKEKSRMTQSVKQRDVGTWQTLLVSASNDSLLDYVIGHTRFTPAGLYRVFEFEVRPSIAGQVDPSDAARTISRLNENYGQVGLEYAKFLGKDPAAIDKMVGEHQAALGKEVSYIRDERFWIGLMSCLILGAELGNKLGYTNINEIDLKKFLIRRLGDMRNERNSAPVDMTRDFDVSNILAQFLNAMRARHTIYTNRIHIAPGKPAPGSIVVKRDASRLDSIYVHVGLEDKLLRISSTYLSQWMADQGYSRHIFTKALEREFGMKKTRGRIGSGTEEYVGLTEYLLEIDLGGTDLINFIDEA